MNWLERARREIGKSGEWPTANTAEGSPGAPKGNKNALKHGRYTTEAIARRREISGLLRAMKALARND
jgi:hypothetical protein